MKSGNTTKPVHRPFYHLCLFFNVCESFKTDQNLFSNFKEEINEKKPRKAKLFTIIWNEKNPNDQKIQETLKNEKRSR